MKRLDILFILIGLLIIVVAVDSAGLNRSTGLKSSDVIVLLGGGDEGRISHAGELYEAGYAEFVFITSAHANEVDYNNLNTDYYGIPGDVILYEDDANSTYEDALFTFELMNDMEFTSAIIVSSDYHIKRARMIFERLNTDEFRLHFSGAPNDAGESWYETGQWYQIWWSEFIKYWGYELRMYRIF